LKDVFVIYLIRNKKSLKLYVGQSAVSVKDRWSGHLSAARCWKRTKKNLPEVLLVDRAIAKHGEEYFEVVEACVCESQEELDFCEELFIEVFNTTDLTRGYNLRSGGKNSKHHPTTKKKQSEVQKSLKIRYKWVTDGVQSLRLRLEEETPDGWRQGRTISPNHLAALVVMRAKFRGKKITWARKPTSPEARVAYKQAGERRRGRKDTPEVKKRKSLSSSLRKNHRTHLKICYCCFNPFNSCSNPEAVTCSRVCHYKLEKIVNQLGSSLAKLYWEKLSPEERKEEIHRRFEVRKQKKLKKMEE
jgi:group I intron endonuclease